MKNTGAVAVLTFKEGLRQRILYGSIIFAVLVMVFAVLISGFFLRDIAKVTIDFCLSAVNIGGILVPLFLGINLLAKDIERKTIYSILSKSISRQQYVIGKFGGLTLLTVAIMAILSLATVLAITGSMQLYGDKFFAAVSWRPILIAICSSFLGLCLLNATVILWSIITTSSFLATLLTLFTYIIGNTSDDILRFVSNPPPDVKITAPILWIVRGAYYLFPNFSAFDFKQQAAHSLAIYSKDLLHLVIYACAYIIAIIGLATLLFKKRDL